MNNNKTTISGELLESAQTDITVVLQKLRTETNGLTAKEARTRLKQYGSNEIAKEKSKSALIRLIANVKNPLVILLVVLGIVSYLTGDIRATIMIFAMVLLGVFLRFFQELRSDKAAEKLKRMVSTVADVLRAGEKKEIPLKELVPGDIVLLSAGDMVPADVRLISEKDLHINQAALTGEALPVEKSAERLTNPDQDPLDIPNICFMGSNVEVGSATAVVVVTGSSTYLGSLATSLTGERELTAFDKGINKFAWLMIQFIMVMVPLVFLLNGLSKGNWLEAFLFAMAVAVGLTPEMLPMIVTVNLSKGAISMSRKKVIVKRLNAIQNFGAMDVLCTDKTGTLTQGKIVLVKHLDVDGNEGDGILNFGFLNSYFQTGLKNLMDVAVLNHTHLEKRLIEEQHFKKIDEIPFDFVRRRMSVVVEGNRNRHILICKGAVEEIFALSTGVEIQGKVLAKDTTEHHTKTVELVRKLNEEGFRVIALAYKIMPEALKAYAIEDETDMVLLGFLAFLDPPKETAKEALEGLHRINVHVKILTGDNEVVTGNICRQVGLSIDHILLGHAVEEMTDAQLGQAAEETTVFAKLSPAHKERIIRALQQQGHVVGFLGDGINDAPALKAADVGISVNSAVDIAKESSDIILLKQSLLVLQEGVIEGRKVFGNIIKYIKMAASSNFGNMFSVVGASIFLPFLPMLPLQVLANNLLYDLSQTTIPTDDVDQEWLMKPRKWAMGEIRRFILFIGPISSIFDYATFFMMLYLFKAWDNGPLFHTGWFIESLFTQTLIIHVIRTNKIPFIQSRASLPLILSSLIIVAFGAWLPSSSLLAGALGFVPLPLLYWPLLAAILLCYMVLTQLIKTWFIRKYAID
ncbi:MAG: magnesium-translocating P-type ATPase [Syntrophus sp. (in: bacteria)]|nr:magnesium-translocating P-type ATPase [Syntrophus sp. (in: bacteria)]